MTLAKDSATPEQGKTFTRRVVIDDRTFVDCVFAGATLVYFGGTPPTFHGCRFEGAHWDFKSSAHNTIGLLRNFARPESGFRVIFDEIFMTPGGPAKPAA